MAFDILKAGTTFPGKVTLSLVYPDGSKQEASLTILFNRLPQNEINELVEAIRYKQSVLKAIEDGREPPNASKGLTTMDDVHIADRVVGGWGDDYVADGEPIPFNEESKQELINFHGMAGAIVMEWMNLAFEGEGKKRTSSKSRANGIGR